MKLIKKMAPVEPSGPYSWCLSKKMDANNPQNQQVMNVKEYKTLNILMLSIFPSTSLRTGNKMFETTTTFEIDCERTKKSIPIKETAKIHRRIILTTTNASLFLMHMKTTTAIVQIIKQINDIMEAQLK